MPVVVDVVPLFTCRRKGFAKFTWPAVILREVGLDLRFTHQWVQVKRNLEKILEVSFEIRFSVTREV